MEKEKVGYIYILTNPSFPDYVKIGYADNVKNRLAELNRTECTPFAFRVYATYEVSSRLKDKNIHSIIDRINPSLRSVDNIEGKRRIREFYLMSAEDAYSLFEAMADLHGTQDKLVKITPTEKEKKEEIEAKENEEVSNERIKPFRFKYCNIKPGEIIEFSCRGNKNDGIQCTVVDDRTVEYNNGHWSLSALAAHLSGRTTQVAGPRYFKYNGQWLSTLRKDI